MTSGRTAPGDGHGAGRRPAGGHWWWRLALAGLVAVPASSFVAFLSVSSAPWSVQVAVFLGGWLAVTGLFFLLLSLRTSAGPVVTRLAGSRPPPVLPPPAGPGREEAPREPAGPAHATYFASHVAPTDWPGLVQSVAARLDGALPDGVAAAADRLDLLLTCGRAVRRVHLAGTIAPPPSDELPRALAAAETMLAEAQRFAVGELRATWPVRSTAPAGEPATTARPAVRAAPGELLLAYLDEAGPVLVLSPVPFETAANPVAP